MKFGQSLSFMIQEENWVKKLLVATGFAVLSPLVIGEVILLGWIIGIARNVIHNKEQKLPSWAKMGEIVKDGFKGLGIILIWYLPCFVLLLIPAIPTILETFLDPSQIAQFFFNPKIVNSFFTIAALYGIFAYIMAICALGVFARSQSFKKALNPSVVFLCFLANKKRYLLTAVFAIFFCSFMIIFGASLCLIGSFPVWAYTATVLGHIFGQACSDQ